MNKLMVAMAMVVALAGRASADIYFSDDFNTENAGVGTTNYTALQQWTVTSGSVDLIGNGYFDFQPGNGLYLDMDGSTNQAGTIATSVVISLPAAGLYEISFDMAGNLRGAPDTDTITANVAVGLFNQVISLAPSVPFTHFAYTFAVASAQNVQISFAGSGNDNQGMLLDNVVLSSAVPEPASLAIWSLIGAVGLAVSTWRRKKGT